jgi:hypothetical protein
MTPGLVYDVINKFTDFILRYAVTLAAVGALSMALIEMIKSLCSWRDRFHKRMVVAWLKSVPMPAKSFAVINPPPASILSASEFHEKVYSQLIRLTTGEIVGSGEMSKSIEWRPWDVSRSNSLFALELEKMMGQIQDAADTALGNPNLNSDLYLFLTSAANIDDISKWFECAAKPPVPTNKDATLAKEQSDTYSRLRQLIRRRLDAFQLTTDYRWQTGNQVVSVLLGAVLLFGSLVYLNHNHLPQTPIEWAGIVVLSIMGGIMAPVAKDLVMALKKVRTNV